MSKFEDIYGVRMSSIREIKDKKTYEIAKKLPHGSGIDADWTINEKNDKILACNSYHAMDSVGYYIGWQEFCLKIPKKKPKDFKLNFTGDRRILKRQPFLREYLEDTIALSLEE